MRARGGGCVEGVGAVRGGGGARGAQPVITARSQYKGRVDFPIVAPTC